MERTSFFPAYLALTTAAVVWGGSVVAQKVALGAFSPVEVSVFRGIGALAILIPLWWWREGTTTFSPRVIGVFMVLGLGVLGNHLLVLYGLQYIGAGAAGIIIGSSPVITALLSSIILHDVPFRLVWLGCSVSFMGVFFVSGAGNEVVGGDNPLLGGNAGRSRFSELGAVHDREPSCHGTLYSPDCKLDDADVLDSFSNSASLDGT